MEIGDIDLQPLGLSVCRGRLEIPWMDRLTITKYSTSARRALVLYLL